MRQNSLIAAKYLSAAKRLEPTDTLEAAAEIYRDILARFRKNTKVLKLL